jgi:hypothetical protein
MNINGTQGFKWIELVKSTFDEIGLRQAYNKMGETKTSTIFN